MIIKEAVGVGADVIEAREDALKKLDAGLEDDVLYEVVSEPKKKVLGIFGGSMAKVRAYIEGPDAPEVKNTEKPQKENREKKAEKPKKVNSAAKEEPEKVKEPEGIPADKVDKNSPAGKAYAYLSEILKKLGVENVEAVISEVEGGSKITLCGNDKLGVIIGRRGETLDALQYLASLVANERGSGYYRVVIDIGNYREKREGTLEALARRTAGQVLRTGRSRSLEPMNPYERRIIHTTVQEIEGVTSTSMGDGAGRRVVIYPEGKTPRPFGDRQHKNDHRGHGRGDRARRPEKASSEVKTAEAQRPKETDGTKLYGKLG